MSDLLDLPILGKLELIEVLEYDNGPSLFTCKDEKGVEYLARLVDVTDDYDVWIYASAESIFRVLAPDEGELTVVSVKAKEPDER